MTPAELKKITSIIESLDGEQLQQAMELQQILCAMTPEQRADFNKKIEARLNELDAQGN